MMLVGTQVQQVTALVMVLQLLGWAGWQERVSQRGRGLPGKQQLVAPSWMEGCQGVEGAGEAGRGGAGRGAEEKEETPGEGWARVARVATEREEVETARQSLHRICKTHCT